jgi:hypothetical protein
MVGLVTTIATVRTETINCKVKGAKIQFRVASTATGCGAVTTFFRAAWGTIRCSVVTTTTACSGGVGTDILNDGTGVDLYELQGTKNSEDLRLQRVNPTSALFKRKTRGLSSVLEQDTITMDATDEFLICAIGGDDLITIGNLFTQLGSMDGGDGTDTCTGPAAWTKVSC